MSKETTIKEGKLIYHKHETAKEFFCERCQATKKAKAVIDWYNSNGEKKVICNGCYGFLLSQK
jgi:hypothetical protein